MLIYLANAVRDYEKKPVAVESRRGWEFQAVVQGAIGLVRPEGPDLLRRDRLWLGAPTFAHGWIGEKNRPARVIVFHFLFVPEVIERLVRRSGHLEIPLTNKQGTRLIELAKQAEPYWAHPSLGSTICFEHILLELSLLILHHQKRDKSDSLLEHDELRVSAAIGWFSERIEQNPGLNEVATATGTSPSNLRRVFQEILKSSPKQIFDQLRYQRAMQLMSDSRMTLESVSEACGFGSASSFSRAFKNKFGYSPQNWR